MTVSQRNCFGKLASIFRSQNAIRVVNSIYSNSVNKVRQGDAETELSDIKTGDRQGDGLSPLLFIIFMDKCIRDTKLQPSHQVVVDADDVAVMVDGIQELQNVASVHRYRL